MNLVCIPLFIGYTQLQLIASFWKLFKILSYGILEAKFGFSTQTLV